MEPDLKYEIRDTAINPDLKLYSFSCTNLVILNTQVCIQYLETLDHVHLPSSNLYHISVIKLQCINDQDSKMGYFCLNLIYKKISETISSSLSCWIDLCYEFNVCVKFKTIQLECKHKITHFFLLDKVFFIIFIKDSHYDKRIIKIFNSFETRFVYSDFLTFQSGIF